MWYLDYKTVVIPLFVHLYIKRKYINITLSATTRHISVGLQTNVMEFFRLIEITWFKYHKLVNHLINNLLHIGTVKLSQ